MRKTKKILTNITIGILCCIVINAMYSCKVNNNYCADLPVDNIQKVTFKLCDSIEVSFLDFSYHFKNVEYIDMGSTPSCMKIFKDSTNLVFSVSVSKLISSERKKIDNLIRTTQQNLLVYKEAKHFDETKEIILNEKKCYSFNGYQEKNDKKHKTIKYYLCILNEESYMSVHFSTKKRGSLNSTDIQKIKCLMQGLKIEKVISN